MPSEIEELIKKLRKAEARRHAASLQAINTLENNMIGSGPAMGGDPVGGQSERRGSAELAGNGGTEDTSIVDRVLGVLNSENFRPLDDIVEAAELDEPRVRTALYSRSLQSRVERKKIGKRMAFRIVTAPVPRKSRKRRAKGSSAADRVRGVLRQHPEGLRAGQVRQELPDVKANTIGAALYNMKNKSRELIYDESTETYRLV